jgi:glyoxylate reductase
MGRLSYVAEARQTDEAMAKVFITREAPGNAPELLRAAGHSVTVSAEARALSRDELAAALKDADAALTMVTDRFDAELLAGAPKLKVIANLAVGYDNVDLQMAADAGVWLTNTPGVLAETTADFAFALLMSAARHVVASDRDTRAGGWVNWSPSGFLGQDVHGATLGIIGMGEIGQAMARRASGFGMAVLYHSRTRQPELEARYGYAFVPLRHLLERADFVSLHTPLNAETRGLMGAAEFALMKPAAILINTARGQVVDQAALIAALQSGTIGGAALDVTDPEPLPLGNPLFAMPNVIITPHIGSASLATRSRMAEMAARNILAVLAGESPPNAVNRVLSPRF